MSSVLSYEIQNLISVSHSVSMAIQAIERVCRFLATGNYSRILL